MSERLLQINFNFSVSSGEYEQAVNSLVDQFANLPGLMWKIWIMNENKKEAGGIYLFEDEASLNEFLTGSLAKTVTSHPALSNFSVKPFTIMHDLTEITQGPLENKLKV
ncbi:MAG: YdhR family protein [Ignavibacteria bacterium]|nr:YdhR family protein [Ignavibacteria bacterium]